MKQSSNYSRQNNRRTSSGHRYDSGHSEFKTILLFYVLPFIVINAIIFFLVMVVPKCEVTIDEADNFTQTTATIKIKSILPVETPVVTLDGTKIGVEKTSGKTYTAVLTSNGVLRVEVKSINKMSDVTFEQVGVLDDTPPTVSDNILQDGILSFKVNDTQAGVDYESITASNSTSSDLMPLSIDRSTGIITFEMLGDTLTVNIKDLLGNENHVTFSSTGESTSSEEESTDGEEEDQTGALTDESAAAE